MSISVVEVIRKLRRPMDAKFRSLVAIVPEDLGQAGRFDDFPLVPIRDFSFLVFRSTSWLPNEQRNVMLLARYAVSAFENGEIHFGGSSGARLAKDLGYDPLPGNSAALTSTSLPEWSLVDRIVDALHMKTRRKLRSARPGRQPDDHAVFISSRFILPEPMIYFDREDPVAYRLHLCASAWAAALRFAWNWRIGRGRGMPSAFCSPGGKVIGIDEQLDDGQIRITFAVGDGASIDRIIHKPLRRHPAVSIGVELEEGTPLVIEEPRRLVDGDDLIAWLGKEQADWFVDAVSSDHDVWTTDRSGFWRPMSLVHKDDRNVPIERVAFDCSAITAPVLSLDGDNEPGAGRIGVVQVRECIVPREQLCFVDSWGAVDYDLYHLPRRWMGMLRPETVSSAQ